MAIDVYLQIDGIKGESTDDKHKDWIECVTLRWGILQPRSATASTGGGHTAERADLKEVSFQKMADLSSPILMQHCAMGKDNFESKVRVHACGWPGDAYQVFRNRTGKRAYRRNRAQHRAGNHLGRTRQSEVFQGEVEIHPAEDWWGRGR